MQNLHIPWSSAKLDFWLPAWFNLGVSHRFSLCRLELRYLLEQWPPPASIWSSTDWCNWDWGDWLFPVLCRSWTSPTFSGLPDPHLEGIFQLSNVLDLPTQVTAYLQICLHWLHDWVFISTEEHSFESFVCQVLRKSRYRVKSLYRIAHILM